MKKQCLAVLAITLFAASALADYPADRKAAMDLRNAGKTEEAMAAFVKLAGSEVTDVQKSDALDQAVRCALRLSQNDRAMELALQIPIKPASITAQMTVMDQTYKSLEIVTKFKEENIDAWPDVYKGDGFLRRGYAALISKDAAMAEADLKKAVEYLTNDDAKGDAENHLGDTYRTLLNDNAKAMETYRLVYKTRNEYKQAYAAIAVAGILTSQKEFDAAIQELQKVPLAKMDTPQWRGTMLIAYGNTYAAQGKKPEAIAKYQEALQVKGLPAYHKTTCEKALQELQSGGK